MKPYIAHQQKQEVCRPIKRVMGQHNNPNYGNYKKQKQSKTIFFEVNNKKKKAKPIKIPNLKGWYFIYVFFLFFKLLRYVSILKQNNHNDDNVVH